MNQTADLTEKTLSREEKYQGSFLSLHVDQVQLPNGRTSFREVVEHVDGVAILALDDRNNVLTVTQYRYVIGKTLLEMTAKGANKGGMVRRLAQRLGISMDHVYCAGDEANDISMLTAGAMGFAPANCIQAVRDCGATIVSNAWEDAMADMVDILDKRY